MTNRVSRTLPLLSATLAASSTIALVARAEPTYELKVMGAREIFPGDPETSSVDARGQVMMGPKVSTLSRLDQPVVASTLEGNELVIATADGRLVRIDSKGKLTQLSGPDEKLVITALASNARDLFLATGPDGAVSKITAGEPRPYFAPKAKYVWSMLAEERSLIITTGEPGQVLAVEPNGRSKILLDTRETHVRSIVRHPTRGLVAGGGQKGVVYQLDGAATTTHGFALFDSSYDEVTALAFDPKSGDLFAAFVSESRAGSMIPGKSIGAIGSELEEGASPIKGSEVVRIGLDGRVDVLWSSRREGALGLAFDGARLMIATGGGREDRGRIYAIEPANRDRVMLFARVEPSIVSTIHRRPDGAILVGTAPIGRVIALGPGSTTNSIYTSAEQDLERPARLGRLWFDAILPNGSRIDVSARTGNTAKVDDTWSRWSTSVSDATGGAIDLPRGRYVQLRATLHAIDASPTLRSMSVSLVRSNIPPLVEEIIVLERGVYLRPLPAEEEREKTISINESNLKRLAPGAPADRAEVRARQGAQPGMLTVSWRATDRNGDALRFVAELRSTEQAVSWTELGRDLELPFVSFDSRSFADGRYVARVSATDESGNEASQVASDFAISDPFVIDNTPPKISNLRAVRQRSVLRIEADVADMTSILGTAEVSLDGGPWRPITAADGLLDTRSERLLVEVDETKLVTKPVRVVALRIDDEAKNQASAAVNVP
ncbi:MAG: hypothetical protein HYV07_21865 [Deltaproteobacteria bacterium]|nr:hypothetical protein [Deltaproteobacteria bacterium]